MEVAMNPRWGPDVFIRNASSTAALILVLCEYVRCFDDEVEYVWGRRMNRVKAIYLSIRYVSLISLLCNTFFLFFGPLSRLPNNPEACQIWFSLLTAFSSFIMFAIDALSMIRIYYLYQRNTKISAFTVSLFITEATLVIASSSIKIKEVPFTPICNVADTPLDVLYYGCWVIVIQITLILMTFHKQKALAGQLHDLTIFLVFQQGIALCSCVIIIFVFNAPYALLTGISRADLILIWPPALLSCTACQMILNVYRMPATAERTCDKKQRSELDIQFTSWFSISSEAGPSEFHGEAGTSLRHRPFRDDAAIEDSQSSLRVSTDVPDGSSSLSRCYPLELALPEKRGSRGDIPPCHLSRRGSPTSTTCASRRSIVDSRRLSSSSPSLPPLDLDFPPSVCTTSR